MEWPNHPWIRTTVLMLLRNGTRTRRKTSVVAGMTEQTYKGGASSKLPSVIWVLCTAAFIIALGYGFIAPVLPQFAASFNVSMAAAAAVISAFAAARLLGAPGAGALVDKLGSRPVYLTGLSIVATATFAVAFAQAYWHILALRFIAGFGSTMFTLSAQAFIVRVIPPGIRGRANALYASSFLLGNIFGPIIGAGLSFLGYRIPFAVYGVGVALAATIVWVATSRQHKPEAPKTQQPPMPLRRAWKQPTYRALLAVAFTNGFVNFGARVSVLPLFAAAIFANGGAASGLALTAFALGTGVTLQFSGRLADRIGRRPCILAGLAVSAIFTGTLGLATTVWVLLLVSVCAGVGGGLMSPASQATLADIIGNDRSGGKVISTYQMVQDSGQIAAPIVIGFLAELFGFAIAFGACGVVALVALLLWAMYGKESLHRSTA